MTDNCPKCHSNNFDLIEYPQDHPDHYDGISEIYCRDCGKRTGRWSGKELEDGEFEPPYGQKRQ